MLTPKKKDQKKNILQGSNGNVTGEQVPTDSEYYSFKFQVLISFLIILYYGLTTAPFFLLYTYQAF